MKRYTVLLAALALAACQDETKDATAPVPSTRQAAIIDMAGNVAGQYIVVTQWNVNDAALAAEYGITPSHTYEHLLNGFAGAIPDDVVQRLAGDPRVISIHLQRLMTKLEVQTNPGSWGIDRIDQRTLPLDNLYNYATTASNVRAYVIDQGIRATHEEFEGRATRGFDAFTYLPTNDLEQQTLGSAECDSHATHVAGTIGGKTYGVAKKVQLIGVRVLNCAGYGNDSDVIAGMDWVAEHGILPAVANMSLGDNVPGKQLGTSTLIDQSLKNLIASGVVVAVAAGNGWGLGAAPGYNACNHPLANVSEALVVGATEIYQGQDYQTPWTSYGACVDVYAPGSGIMSSTSVGDNTTGSNSGTSMAAPHVAGAAALLLGQAPALTPAEVHDIIWKGATLGVIQKGIDNTTAYLDTTPLRMLYSGVKPPQTLLTKKNGKTVPCTPRRKLQGEC